MFGHSNVVPRNPAKISPPPKKNSADESSVSSSDMQRLTANRRYTRQAAQLANITSSASFSSQTPETWTEMTWTEYHHRRHTQDSPKSNCCPRLTDSRADYDGVCQLFCTTWFPTIEPYVCRFYNISLVDLASVCVKNITHWQKFGY